MQFSTIAREVGLKDGGAWVLAEGADAAVMTRSIPMEKMLKDAIMAYGQNGEAIRPEQGYPLRLMLPGLRGQHAYQMAAAARSERQAVHDARGDIEIHRSAANGKARQFSFDMEAKSVITFPSGEMKLPGPGFYKISGFAWTGAAACNRSMSRSTAARPGCRRASNPVPEPICTVRFRFPWIWDGKPAVLQSRCTDETGYIQPTLKATDRDPRLERAVRLDLPPQCHPELGVAADGSVTNVHA